MLSKRKKIFALICLTSVLASACGTTPEGPRVANSLPTTMAAIPSVSLNYRYEADVPQPESTAKVNEELNAAVLADFDQNRSGEVLDRTLTSPDKKRVLAIYHQNGDLGSEFRLDMYTPEGKLINKVTADLMAVHFPDTIVWSPDSTSLAFVAMIRGANDALMTETPAARPTPDQPDSLNPDINANSNSNSDLNSNIDPEAVESTPTPEPIASITPAAPTGILTFRTEQIYLCDADGVNLKPITQNEGLIYFYYAWSPDSTALVALAATAREWQYLQYLADKDSEIFVPVGRPRLVEKTGRERRLDDALTAVQPVWSPDSAKVAAAFDTQVRVYDAVGTTPTQAAIPLRNNLLLSAQAYDMSQQQSLNAANSNSNVQPGQLNTATLPDEKSLVSFNPIVTLSWTNDQILYFQTAFVKRMKIEADSVTSFQRWHRLVFSPQPQRTN